MIELRIMIIEISYSTKFWIFIKKLLILKVTKIKSILKSWMKSLICIKGERNRLLITIEKEFAIVILNLNTQICHWIYCCHYYKIYHFHLNLNKQICHCYYLEIYHFHLNLDAQIFVPAIAVTMKSTISI